MPTQSYVIVIVALLVPGALYWTLALREHSRIHSLTDFFPLTRYLSATKYRSTVVAAGMSLATVMIALINLAPLLGVGLFITIGTYAIGFLFLVFAAPRIMMANPRNDTLQGYLGTAYNSPTMRKVASIFTLIGYLSIFSMELLVGVSILSPFLGGWVLSFAFVYLLFLVAYSCLSGFRAIVVTDVWQLRFIALSIAALIVYFVSECAQFRTTVFSSLFNSQLLSWNLPLSFCAGIAAMNIPAPISDTGTWQRLCSARSPGDARRGLASAVLFFVIIWGTLIMLGCFYAQLMSGDASFDLSKHTLMTTIIHGIGSHHTLLHGLILFAFILGLFSAMISTADSLLIAGSQVFVMNILEPGFAGAKSAPRPLHSDQGVNSASHQARQVNLARWSLAVLALVSFAIFATFQMVAFNVVELIFAIYGAQLALFPSTFAALFLGRWINIPRTKYVAVASVTFGFCSAWSVAIYGKWIGSADCQFFAPVVALLVAGVILVCGFHGSGYKERGVHVHADHSPREQD